VDEAVDRLKARTTAVFAVTLGKDGTLLRCGEEVFPVPSIPVKPVDTTGAGDAFVGAVLYQLSRRSGEGKSLLPGDKENWRNIVLNANKAGARTCEFMGAMEAFRHLNNSIFS
jgi:fructokinase